MITQKNKCCRLLFVVFLGIFFLSCKKNECHKNVSAPPQEFLKYSIDGTNYIYSAPADTMRYTISDSAESPTFAHTGRVSSKGLLDDNYSVFTFLRDGISLNSNQRLSIFGTTTVFGAYNPLISQNPLYVRITEYGAIGEFISGEFTGVLFEAQNQSVYHNITCSFRVRRSQ